MLPRARRLLKPEAFRAAAGGALHAPPFPECDERLIRAGNQPQGAHLAWYDNVFSMIDLRSFTNIWFWVALAVMWSSLSHYIIGVPFDMVQRARRSGGQAMVDLEALVDIQTRRQLYILRTGGVWVIGFWSAFIATLAVVGFFYCVEVAQALTLLILPMSVVFVMGFRLAARIEAEAPRNEALTRRLTWHRLKVQLIGMLSILIAALWGMWQFQSASVLGR